MLLFGETLAASRESYFLNRDVLLHLSPTYSSVRQHSESVVYLPQHYSVRLLGSMWSRSLSYRFSLCFPHFSLSETENEWKTIE